jgi:hypothetical protein
VTFPGLRAQAVSTNLFATQAAKVLGQLTGDLVGLSPGDPVPQAATFIIRVQFKALAQSAGEEATTAAGLAQDVQAFVAANRAADAALEQLPLGGWAPVAGPIATLESAMTDVQGSWGPISSQLAAAADGTLEITTAGLLSSNVQEGITFWQGLAGAAAAFDGMASKLVSVESG